MNVTYPHRDILQAIAKRAMIERGLLPEFSPAAMAELSRINEPATISGDSVRDLRDLLWCSIDNDDSRDLDQLTVAEAMPDGNAKIYVAVADVDALVTNGSAIDDHARQNTTSVYTAAMIFPMLPEKLSTNLTSLNFNEDRISMVVEMVIAQDGSLVDSSISIACVRNHAKLAYNAVAAWLDGEGPQPEEITAVPGLAENLRLQDQVAQILKQYRHDHGALSLETIETKSVFNGEELSDLAVETKNRAKSIIEDFMITANGVTARFLASKGFPSIRRVVRKPKRWDRIVELAALHKCHLSEDPDSKALEKFLQQAKADDPLRFPDLSLSIIKLMGAGEYVADFPNSSTPGHFGLAVRDYSHSTAPNRRYPDLITQRLVKAALAGEPIPYSGEQLDDLARHCTREEDDAKKVERQVGKSAAALLLEHRIGEHFDAVVTGVTQDGAWARLLSLPVEGKIVRGTKGIDVGDRIHVQLLEVDVDRGYIDFGNLGRSRR